jgi:hypothetical protein
VSTPAAIGTLASSTASGTGTLPAINPATEPAAVRNGSPAVKQAYQSALSFESVLVGQLSQQLVSSAGLSGSSSSATASSSTGSSSTGGDAATSAFGSMLPGALTSAIMGDGGLGLAAQLLPDFESASGITASTGTAPAIGAPSTTAGGSVS